MMYSIGLCVVLLLGLVVQHSEACSCLPVALQDKYCNADFVIRVKIVSRVRIGGLNGDYRYGITKLKTYRFDKNSAYKSTDKTYLWTGGNSALCGVHLDVGKTYIITGSVGQNRLNFNSCGWQAEWKSLTCYQMEAVKKTWKKQCGNCKIKYCSDCESCYGVPCGLDVIVARPPPDTCILNFSRPGAHCYQKYSVCRQKNNRCSFETTQELTDCKSCN